MDGIDTRSSGPGPVDRGAAADQLVAALRWIVAGALREAMGGHDREDGAAVERGLLRVRDAAEWLAVSETKVREWIDRGVLPVVRCDRMVRIRPEDLAEFRDRMWR